LGRDDLRNFRGKETNDLIRHLLTQRRTIILFTHRHSLASLREALPRNLLVSGEIPLNGSWRGLFEPEYCYMAVVERK
jgi:hypothetical protein